MKNDESVKITKRTHSLLAKIKKEKRLSHILAMEKAVELYYSECKSGKKQWI